MLDQGLLNSIKEDSSNVFKWDKKDLKRLNTMAKNKIKDKMKDQVPIVLLNEWLDIKAKKSKFWNRQLERDSWSEASDNSIFSDTTSSVSSEDLFISNKEVPDIPASVITGIKLFNKLLFKKVNRLNTEVEKSKELSQIQDAVAEEEPDNFATLITSPLLIPIKPNVEEKEGSPLVSSPQFINFLGMFSWALYT